MIALLLCGKLYQYGGQKSLKNFKENQPISFCCLSKDLKIHNTVFFAAG